MKGLFQCPPRASPWVLEQVQKVALKGQKLSISKLLPFQGDFVFCQHYPGRCPGLGASALSGRVEFIYESFVYNFRMEFIYESFVYNFRSLANSQTTMPAVTLTFRECLVPNCGISRQPSLISTMFCFTPFTSLPKITA